MSIPESTIELKLLVRALFDKILKLESTVAQLEKENLLLKEENAELKEENAELRSKLKLDSHNSSKPPSSDGYQKKPAFPRNKNGKQGGQKNHNGKTLEMVKNPDHIVTCKTEECTCGFDLTQEPTTVLARRQKFDLPEPRLEVTEYQLAQNTCPQCGQIHKGKFPKDINAPVQYGHRVKALTVLLNNDCRLPFEKIQTLFDDLYGYPINEGTIAASNQTCYENLEQPEKKIQENLIASPVVHNDESGVRCQGKLHWLHVASTALFTYLFIHPKRGKEAIESEKSILPRFFGWSVHDCLSSYFNLTKIKHAICGAHLLRELQAQIENGSNWANAFKDFLLRVYYTPIPERIDNRKKIEQEFDEIIAQAEKEEPVPKKTGKRGKLKRTKGRNLFERLQTHKNAVLAFAFYPEVPFTNNQAERDVRPVKVKQKVSGCFRTVNGAEQYARIAGYISTVRKHQLNIFKELCNVFYGNSFLITQTS